ncbi:MAG: CerR family C-terminal domain-containing protein [Phycisphaerae bacterium]|nr:CerR family C-terminal domain-containing protein [Phycisphaerae bacterium]
MEQNPARSNPARGSRRPYKQEIHRSLRETDRPAVPKSLNISVVHPPITVDQRHLLHRDEALPKGRTPASHCQANITTLSTNAYSQLQAAETPTLDAVPRAFHAPVSCQGFARSASSSSVCTHHHARPVISRLYPDQTDEPPDIDAIAEHLTRFSLAARTLLPPHAAEVES